VASITEKPARGKLENPARKQEDSFSFVRFLPMGTIGASRNERQGSVMSTIGWTNSVNASSVLDKVQHAQQMQEEAGQAQAKARALEEDRTRLTTVTETPEEEKARLEAEENRRREERRKRKRKRSSKGGPEPDSDGEEEPARRTVDIRV
jgi:hypothetical protein